RVTPIPSTPVATELVPEPVARELVPEPVPATPASAPCEKEPLLVLPPRLSSPGDVPPRVTPLAPQRFGLQFTLDQAGHDLLRNVQNLLGNQVPSGDLAEVIVRALKVYADHLEKRKCAQTERPASGHRACHPDSRHVPSHVKRTVWKRDGGQCSYVSD